MKLLLLGDKNDVSAACGVSNMLDYTSRQLAVLRSRRMEVRFHLATRPLSGAADNPEAPPVQIQPGDRIRLMLNCLHVCQHQ